MANVYKNMHIFERFLQVILAVKGSKLAFLVLVHITQVSVLQKGDPNLHAHQWRIQPTYPCKLPTLDTTKAINSCPSDQSHRITADFIKL